jgi:hypothetical protein
MTALQVLWLAGSEILTMSSDKDCIGRESPEINRGNAVEAPKKTSVAKKNEGERGWK